MIWKMTWGKTRTSISSNPLLAKKILSQLHEWQKKSGVDMPTLNTGYLPENDIRTKH